jgi:hypothetical protein
VERPPRLQIGFLHQIFGGIGTATQPRGNAEQLADVHQGRPVELFAAMV